jgi:hypothetical protein
MEHEHEWEWWFVTAGFFLLGSLWGWGVANLTVLHDVPLYLTFGAGGCALVLVAVRLLKHPASRGPGRQIPH